MKNKPVKHQRTATEGERRNARKHDLTNEKTKHTTSSTEEQKRYMYKEV